MTTTTDGRTNERKTVDDGDVSRSVSMILENVELTVYVSVKHGFSSMVDLETVFVFFLLLLLLLLLRRDCSLRFLLAQRSLQKGSKESV